MAEYKIKKEYAFSIGEQIQAEDGESFTITGTVEWRLAISVTSAASSGLVP